MGKISEVSRTSLSEAAVVTHSGLESNLDVTAYRGPQPNNSPSSHQHPY
jgi:hypothetical protein